jgi:hypothetical protein
VFFRCGGLAEIALVVGFDGVHYRDRLGAAIALLIAVPASAHRGAEQVG